MSAIDSYEGILLVDPACFVSAERDDDLPASVPTMSNLRWATTRAKHAREQAAFHRERAAYFENLANEADAEIASVSVKP
jgi:hypothetical protein